MAFQWISELHRASKPPDQHHEGIEPTDSKGRPRPVQTFTSTDNSYTLPTVKVTRNCRMLLPLPATTKTAMTHPPLTLSLQQVSKSFSGHTVIDGLSLDVPQGSTTALIGPSGCGKSTLLRLMNGLLRPDQGTVVFDGQALSSERMLTVRQRIGYVIQDGGLFPHLSAAENVALMARHGGWTRTRIEARLAELAELVQLNIALLQRYPAQLSGGQRQRVALMRALMLNPELLLLDEPLGALDPIIRYDLQGELRDIFRRLARTVVIVTHDLAEAGWFGDRVVLLNDGGIAQSGTLTELSNAPANAFVEQFVRAQRGHQQDGDEGQAA